LKNKRVVIALSGGVDSSVAAYLLKQKKYDVIGVFMKNWHDESVTKLEECPWLEDSTDAMMIAEKLKIPFQSIDFSKIYKKRIVDYMFKEYAMGRTPNPDILCNREIKFDVFMKTALSLDADFIATGHYCQKRSFIQKKSGKEIFQLFAGEDKTKDQSYFLCQLSQKQLARSLFPVGVLKKTEVRKIATEQNLVTADKKDSQGLCFIGKIKLPDFLQQKLIPKEGDIIEIPDALSIYDKSSSTTFNNLEKKLINYTKKIKYVPAMGKIVGKHNGAHYFTIGQRKGMGVGGTQDPLFVINTDTERNIIYVGQGKQHKGLLRQGLKIKNKDVYWVRADQKLKIDESLEVKGRVRYRQKLQKVTLYQKERYLYVIFEEKQWAITSGQFFAWYIGDELFGSGVIN